LAEPGDEDGLLGAPDVQRRRVVGWEALRVKRRRDRLRERGPGTDRGVEQLLVTGGHRLESAEADEVLLRPLDGIRQRSCGVRAQDGELGRAVRSVSASVFFSLANRQPVLGVLSSEREVFDADSG
jgi:hypothetical protein